MFFIKLFFLSNCKSKSKPLCNSKKLMCSNSFRLTAHSQIRIIDLSNEQVKQK